MATAVLEQLGVLGDLATFDGLEGSAEALERAHAADDQAEAAPDVAVGLPLGELEGGGDGQGGVGGGCAGGAPLVLRLAHVRPPRGRWPNHTPGRAEAPKRRACRGRAKPR